MRVALTVLICLVIVAGIGWALAVAPIPGDPYDADAYAAVEPSPDDSIGELPVVRPASNEVPYLLSALRDPNPAVRYGAAISLLDNHRQDRSVVPALLPLLHDDHPTVRSYAASALGDLGDKRATEGLIAALRDVRQGVVTSAIMSLRQLGDQRATEPLIELLDSEDAYIAQEAVEALGDIPDTRAVEPLIRILEDTKSRLRADAAKSLGGLRDQRAIPALIAGLGDADTAVRGGCANSLRFLPDTRAVAPLIRVLNDRDGGIRWCAADALGPIKDRRAIIPLMRAAMDRDADVRMCAVLSLGDFKDPRVVELLLSTLEYDNDYSVQRCAASSLGVIRSRRAVPDLLECLRRTKWNAYENSELRVSAIWALGRIGDERAVEPLIALLEHPLDYMGESMCGHEKSTWRAISGALADIGGERAMGYLMRSLREGNAGAVCGAYRYFIGKGIAGSDAVLMAALSQYGDYTMACYFALSGNNRLEEAARRWAKKDRRPIEPNAYAKKHAVRWGTDPKPTTED